MALLHRTEAIPHNKAIPVKNHNYSDLFDNQCFRLELFWHTQKKRSKNWYFSEPSTNWALISRNYLSLRFDKPFWNPNPSFHFETQKFGISLLLICKSNLRIFHAKTLMELIETHGPQPRRRNYE